MMIKLRYLFDVGLLSFFIVVFFACRKRQHIDNRKELRQFYFANNVDGFFVLYNESNNSYTYYNQQFYRKAYPPSSTFNVFITLVALEEGAIKDEAALLQWDHVKRSDADWNKNQDLKEAFKHSTDWYFSQLVDRVGLNKIKYWMDKCSYGNADTSGGAHDFWKTGGLKISAEEQIDFLKNIHQHKLPFAPVHIRKVTELMSQTEDGLEKYISCTGIFEEQNINYAWHIGLSSDRAEMEYFALIVHSGVSINGSFADVATRVSQQVLRGLQP